MTASPILQTTAQIALYAMKLLALWIFLRGHHWPGGGFIAGLVAAAAIVLQGLAFGLAQAQAVFPWPFTRLIAIGLLLTAGTGTAGLLIGQPFLTHGIWHSPHLPLFGEFELASAAVFDLGVFLTVVGSTKGIIVAIAADSSMAATGPFADVRPGAADADADADHLSTAAYGED